MSAVITERHEHGRKPRRRREVPPVVFAVVFAALLEAGRFARVTRDALAR